MSIRQKIFLSSVVVVFLMFIALASFFFFHRVAIVEYKTISENLILENELAQKVNVLVESYNAIVIAPSSQERKETYKANYEDIARIIRTLDEAVESEDSKVAYAGLRRIVLLLLEDCQNGITALESGDTTVALEYYNDAQHKLGFVLSNTTSFLLTEIQHLHEVQERIEKRYSQQLWATALWTLLLVFGAVLYALIFARRITSPVNMLSHISAKVSEGNFNQQIPQELLSRSDEVGGFARSFHVMLEKLNHKINQVETANETILKTQEDLTVRNQELEKFNRMVVGRELKMIELKERIATLEEKLKDCDQAKLKSE